MLRLVALAELDLDHLDLLVLRAVAEAFGVEAAACIAAAEIAAAELPHDVAAVGAMIGAEAAFAGVVVEIAQPRAEIERLDRPRAERAEAHRRDIEQRRLIGARALCGADLDPPRPVVADLRRDAVAHPFIFVRIDVEFGSERVSVEIALGAGIDNIALGTGEGAAVERAFDDIGIEAGPQILEQPRSEERRGGKEWVR